MGTLPLFGSERPGAGEAKPDDAEAAADSPKAEPKAKAEEERVYRVAELNRSARGALEGRFSDIWVEGEASDVTRAASGHVYFTLNDERDAAQVRCVMFRGDAARAKARIEDGARLRLRGTVSLYEPRGSFQLLARIALPVGEGLLAQEFERIRKKLEGEGLLDPARKRPLPLFPRTVAVVTSEQGAALHDILRVTEGRAPVRILIADCRVQGEGAPESIVRALALVARVPDVDVIIVARGGGSAEDLWAFNDERVARAIAGAAVPVVSGVGHEVDITIADLVADVRAATPSNAAELVVPEAKALAARVDASARALARAMETALGRARLRLEKLDRHLEDPRRAVAGVRARLANLRHALERMTARRLSNARAGLVDLTARLASENPRRKLAADRARLQALHEATLRAVVPLLSGRRLAVGTLAGKLDALSPLAVLGRGYAIALDAGSGRALLRAADTRVGAALHVRLHEGSVHARVEAVLPAPEAGGEGTHEGPHAPRKAPR